MDFTPFDTGKPEEYAAEARRSWGHTEAYREYEQKSQNRSREEEQAHGAELMELFAGFGAMRARTPESPEVQAQVEKLQAFITEHYYRCTNEILSSLGQMYTAGGDFTANIDAAGSQGTAAFVNRAIESYCRRK